MCYARGAPESMVQASSRGAQSAERVYTPSVRRYVSRDLMDRAEVLVLQKDTVPRSFLRWYRMISQTLGVRENIRYPGGIGASFAGPPDLLRGHYLGCRSRDLARGSGDPDCSPTPSDPWGTRRSSMAQVARLLYKTLRSFTRRIVVRRPWSQGGRCCLQTWCMRAAATAMSEPLFL